MSEILTSVPETDDLDEQLQAMREAESETVADDEQSEEREAEADDGETQGQAEAEEEELEPLSAEEWKKRHDNLQKALHQERAKRKEGDADREWRQQMEQRLSELQQKATPSEKKSDATEKPDRTKDPLAYLDWLDSKVSEYEAREREEASQTEQRQQQQRQMEEFRQFCTRSEVEFRAEVPDYDDAAKFYAASRVAELTAMYEASDQTAPYAQQLAQQRFHQEMTQSVADARQVGFNPAAAIYKAALARGYEKEARKQAAPAEEPKRYDKMKEGQKASKSLVGGGKVTPDTSVATLLDDDEDPLEALHAGNSEFDKAWSKFARQQR
jgi:hypothetical protein